MNKCKKIIIPILIIAMFFMCISKTEYAANTTLKIGDINGDGAIDSRDTLKILEHIAASTIPKIKQNHSAWILTGDKLKAADINVDGQVDSRDTLKELEYIAAKTIPTIAKKHPDWKTYIEKKWIVDVSGIKLNKTNLSIEKGKASKLVATLTPTNASNKVVTWSSSNTKVASVDGIGNVEGKSAGITIITATTKNGKSAKCEVKITEKSTPQPTATKNISSLNIALSTTSVTYNGKAQTPAVTIKDGSTVLKNGTNYTLSYSKNINAGTAIITITGKGNYKGTATKIFTINPYSIANTTITGIVDKTYTGKSIKQNVLVKDASKTLVNEIDYTIIYQNNIKIGMATILITGKGNYNGTAKRTFNIKEITPTNITLSKSSITIEQGDTYSLIATIYPSNAANKKVTWSSSNTNVATINNSGKITAKGAGTCYITAVTANSKEAKCKITVKGDQLMNPGAPLNVKTGFSKESYKGMQYYKSVPDNPTEKMALIVFLHGDGEQNKMNKLGNMHIVKYVKSKEPYKAGKFVFIAPLRTTKHWASGDTLQTLMKLIEKTANDYKVDKNRIILTGMSSGGNGTWNIACKYQNYFAAIVPMSAKTAGASAKKLTNIPIWGICGNTTSDEKERNRQMTKLINEINKKNGKKLARLETIQSASHGTIQKYYRRIELFKWMLSQKKN